jgi:hypothetical protein
MPTKTSKRHKYFPCQRKAKSISLLSIYHGLIKDRLANSPRPTTLAELMKSTTTHDSRISERILERKANSTRLQPISHNSSSTSNASSTPSQTSSHGVPIPRHSTSGSIPQTSPDRSQESPTSSECNSIMSATEVPSLQQK